MSPAHQKKPLATSRFELRGRRDEDVESISAQVNEGSNGTKACSFDPAVQLLDELQVVHPDVAPRIGRVAVLRRERAAFVGRVLRRLASAFEDVDFVELDRAVLILHG